MGMKETYSCHALNIDRHESQPLLEQSIQVVPIISQVPRLCEVEHTNEVRRRSFQAWTPQAKLEQIH